MRLDDVACAPQPPSSYRTHGLYLPARQTYDQMSSEQLKRGLCQKAAGDWHKCLACQGGCTAGRMLAARMKGEVQEPETPARENRELILNLKKPEEKADKKWAPTRENCPALNEAMIRRLEKAMQKYVRAMQRMMDGEDPEAACRAEGYERLKSLLGFRRRNREACCAALAAAGIPDQDIRRKKRGCWT